MTRSARTFALAMLALLPVACARTEAAPVGASGDVHAQHSSAAHDPALHDAPGADAPLSGMSLYQLASEWTDQHGATRTLDELRGRPQAVAMVYTNCGSACPRIVADLKRLEAEFPELGFVLVSIDPERDTPGRLREFATGSRLGERWTLLHGSDDDILELATVLGVRYRRISQQDFMHSNVITLLDANGVAVHRQEALGEVEGTMAAVRSLLSRGA